ncbi:MAG: 1-acyl-sn-glycerol-3-phosphate acyltransferase [Planctomycetes bacterium]|nr:1-acyl-sn-glycerol-3-phosphate acyltransferase [Planctomycetota bacterium]
MSREEHILVKQDRPTGWRGWIYLRMVEFSLAMVRMFMFLKVVNPHKIPKRGPLILIANHPSYFDPPTLVGLLIYYAGRDLSFMAWDKLFKVPVVRFFTNVYKAYPVNRENPGRGPYVTLLNILEKGGAAGVFPEGSRSNQALMGDWKPGALRAAFATKATILPVTMATMGDLWPRDALLPYFWRSHKIIFHDPLTYDQYMAGKPPEMLDRQWQEQLAARIRTIINAPLVEKLEAREKLRQLRLTARDIAKSSEKSIEGQRAARIAAAKLRLGVQ